MLLIFSLFFVFILGLSEITYTGNFKKGLLILSFIWLVILIGFRNMGGSDFLLYRDQYIAQTEMLNWEEGYLFISKFIHNLGFSFQAFIFIISSFCLLLLFSCVKQYSPLWLFSIVLYMSSFMVYYNIIALRQMFALFLFVFSYRYIEKRKIIPFAIIIVLCFLFHKSALICTIAYPFCVYLKLNRRTIFVCLTLALMLSYIDYNYLYSFIGNADVQGLLEDRLESYTSEESGIDLLKLSKSGIVSFLILYKYKSLKDKPYFVTLTKIYFLFMLLFIAFHKWSIMIRVFAYFEIAFIFIVPFAFKCIKMEYGTKILCYLLLCVLFGTALIVNVINFDNGDLLYYSLQ